MRRLWTEILTDFDPDEETANFGTRVSLVTEGNLYEVTTLSTIEPVGGVDDSTAAASSGPAVSSLTTASHVFLALDSVLVILSIDCQEAHPLVWESCIDVFTVSACGHFLAAGLRDGSLQLVHVASRRILASFQLAQPAQDTQACFAAVFFQTTGSDTARLCLLCQDTGRLVVFEHLGLDGLQQALQTGDLNALAAAKERLIQSEVSLVPSLVHCSVLIPDLFGGEGGEVLAVSTPQNLVLLSSSHRLPAGPAAVTTPSTLGWTLIHQLDTAALDGEPIVRLAYSRRLRLLMCVDAAGIIHLVSPTHMVAVAKLDLSDASKVNVMDLTVLEDEGSDLVQLMLLTSEPGGHFLEIRQLSLSSLDFKVVFRLAVSPVSHLISTALSQEVPMLLEGGGDARDESSSETWTPERSPVSKLRVRGIAEGIPEVRLARMLRRRRFEEAEAFAVAFGLDKEALYRAKADWLLNKLSVWQQQEDEASSSQLFADLTTTLSQIKDLEFIVECCCLASLPSIGMTRQLLLFARQRLNNVAESSSGGVSQRQLLVLGATLHRLETFIMMTEGRVVSGEKEEEAERVKAWFAFSRANILAEIKRYLAAGTSTSIQSAVLLWVRHRADFLPSLDLAGLQQLLQCSTGVATRSDLEDQLRWLRQLIPDMLAVLPTALPALATWTLHTLTQMEQQQQHKRGIGNNVRQWPDNGLQFAEEMLSAMQLNNASGTNNNLNLTLLTLNQQRAEPDSPLSHLVQLIIDLGHLSTLSRAYRIRLTLAEFQDPNKADVIQRILDWIHDGRDIVPLMDGFLIKFITTFCGLDLSEVIREYVLYLVTRSGVTWHWHIGAAPWEEKAAALLAYISNADDRAAAVLAILKTAPVPWSPTVEEQVYKGSLRQATADAAQRIRAEKSLVTVKTILRKYDCKTCPTHGDGPEAERLLRFLLHRSDCAEDAFRDIQEVTRVCMPDKPFSDLIQLYAEHLVEERQDAAAALRLIQGMTVSGSAKEQVCEALLMRSGLVVRMEVGQAVEAAYMELIRRIMDSGLLNTKTACGADTYQEAGALVRAHALKVEFGLSTRETDLNGQAATIRDVSACRALLSSYLAQQISHLCQHNVSGEHKQQSLDGAAEDDKLVAFLDSAHRAVLRICDLTGLSQEEGQGRLIMELVRGGLYRAAMRLAGVLVDVPVTPAWAQMLQTVIYSLELELADGGGGQSEEEDVGRLTAHMGLLGAQSLTYCDGSALIDGLELANWQALSAWVHQESHSKRAFAVGDARTEPDVYAEWRFSSVYRDRGLPLERASLLPQLSACLRSYLPLVGTGAVSPLPYLPRSFCCLVEVLNLDVTCPDLEAEGCGFSADEVSGQLAAAAENAVRVLRQAGHSQAAFAVLQRCLAPLGSLALGLVPDQQAAMQERLSASCQSIVASLLPRILAEGSRPAADLGISYLTATGEDKRATLSLLARLNTSLGLDYRRLGSLALLGRHYCRLGGLGKQADQFSQLYVKAAWGRRLAEMGVCFKAAFSGGGKKECLDVLEKMVQHPQVTVELLQRFATAFGIEEDMSMMRLVSWQLTRLQPHLRQEEATATQKKEHEEIEGGGTREEGRLEAVAEMAAITLLLEQALTGIRKEDILYEYLLKEFSTVSPYNYEAHAFLLRALQRTAQPLPSHMQRAEQILPFLNSYRRVRPPQLEEEVDRWLKERPSPFPKIASIRLPLYSLVTLSTKDKAKLLEQEFQLETYRDWIHVSAVLGIAVDSICMFTVKNTVNTMLETSASKEVSKMSNDPEEWSLGHTNKSILEKLQECIALVPNHEKANATTHWLVKRLPKGADKVLASVGLVQVAEEWHQSDSSNPSCQRGLEIARESKQQLETEQVLHKHGLARPALLDLVHQKKPLELIYQLYEDPSVVERNRVVAGNYPDIDKAAKTIAAINKIDHTQVKYDLLDKWLPLSSSSASSGMNDTLSDFTLNLNAAPPEADGSEERNLLRCVYLLQDGSQEGMRYLLRYASSTDPGLATDHKIRALNCLFSIAKEADIENLMGRPVAEVKEDMRNLTFIARLEALNLPCNLESFATCDKLVLAEGIWRSCRHSSEGVCLVRDLCMEYNIWQLQLWSALLLQMTKYRMVEELRPTLLALNAQPHLWKSKEFLEAWNLVLAAPFTSLQPPVIKEIEEKCCQTLRLVFYCPTAMDLALDGIAEDCLRAGLPHLAAVLLPCMPQAAADQLREKLHNQVSREELAGRLKTLEKEGFPTIGTSFSCGIISRVESSAAL